MPYWVNFFPGEAPLVEDAPQGDASIELHVDARAEAALASVCQIGSFELSHLMAQLFVAGVNSRQRAVARSAPAPSSSSPG